MNMSFGSVFDIFYEPLLVLSRENMSKNSARNIPKQTRSQQRVNLILDTAADLFIEVGYEAMTTNAIAERADISIGSLYRYFPDKDAILHALAARYHQKEQELFDRVFTQDVIYLPLPVLLDRFIDPFLEMYTTCPAYAHILLGADVSVEIAAASYAIDQEVIGRLANILRQVNPHLDEPKARLIAVVCKANVKILISLRSSCNDEAFQTQLTAAIKHMLLLYLREALGKNESD